MKFPSRLHLFFCALGALGVLFAVLTHADAGELIFGAFVAGTQFGWWIDAFLDEREKREG